MVCSTAASPPCSPTTRTARSSRPQTQASPTPPPRDQTNSNESQPAHTLETARRDTSGQAPPPRDLTNSQPLHTPETARRDTSDQASPTPPPRDLTKFQPPNTPETGPTHLAPLLPAHTQSSPPNFVWGNLDGQQFTMLLDTVYTKVVHWRRNCFSVPFCKAGKDFVTPDCTYRPQP